MKYIILLLLSFNLNAQKFNDCYLGNDYLLYKGTTLSIKNVESRKLKDVFYKELKDCTGYFESKVIYPLKNDNHETSIDSLINRTFKVLDIVHLNGKSCIQGDYFSYPESPMFELYDTMNQEKLYYKYDTEREYAFPFSCVNFNHPKDYFNKTLIKSQDEFTNEITIRSPLMLGNKRTHADLTKSIDKGVTTYYLAIESFGNTLSVNKKGVIILFLDNTKLMKQTPIDVKVDEHGYVYTAFIPLSNNDLTQLSTKKIKGYKLYIYEGYLDDLESYNLMKYANAIKSAK